MTTPSRKGLSRFITTEAISPLFSQKAVITHLKHPDWKVAFVFFTRSLYDQKELIFIFPVRQILIELNLIGELVISIDFGMTML